MHLIHDVSLFRSGNLVLEVLANRETYEPLRTFTVTDICRFFSREMAASASVRVGTIKAEPTEIQNYRAPMHVFQ